MPSEKAARVAKRRKIGNLGVRTAARTYVSRARRLINAGDMAAAEAAVNHAITALDKAAQKGAVHPNNAARRKSRIMHNYNSARAQASSAPSSPSP